MVQIEKNGIVLFVPRPVYELNFKDNGWKIVGNEKKEVASIEQHKKDEVKQQMAVKEVKNSNKKK